jgi:hypothetical protein
MPRLARRTSSERRDLGRARRRAVPLEQLPLALDIAPARWSYSRLVVRSGHFERIRDRVEFVRSFFPELGGLTIRVGLAQKRGVLGWGSMDPERPGIWVRPRRLELFTIAHEMTHLLQARGLVPRGERACDLWALARSALVIDSVPGYLKMPRHLRDGSIGAREAALLHRLACESVSAREQGDRRYLQRFEQAVARAHAMEAA